MFAWIRINLNILDPDPLWQNGSGGHNIEKNYHFLPVLQIRIRIRVFGLPGSETIGTRCGSRPFYQQTTKTLIFAVLLLLYDFYL